MEKLRHRKGVTRAQAGEKPGLQVPTGLSSPCQLEGGGVEKVQVPHPRKAPQLRGGVPGKSTALIPWPRGWKRGNPSCRGPSELCGTGHWFPAPPCSLPQDGHTPLLQTWRRKDFGDGYMLGLFPQRGRCLGSGYLVFSTFPLKPEGQ